MARPRNWHGVNAAEERPHLDPLIRALYERRCELGVSQLDLATRSGISLSAIQRWETGRAKPRMVYLVDVWAQALGAHIDRSPRLVCTERKE